MSPKKVDTPRLIPAEEPANSGGPEISKEQTPKKIAKDQGKLYQDQIYGPKVLSLLAADIIDTPEFQRLEGIKQLGFANVTYRGAKHTRFSHSIGTYFITKTIMRRIVQNHERFGYDHPGKDLPVEFSLFPHNVEADKPTFQSKWRGLTEVVSLAALLHDITHVPFGHTLEDEFINIYDKHDVLGGPRLDALLFGNDSVLSELLINTNKNRLKGISNKELKELIYVILSWKEKVDAKNLTGIGFDKRLSDEIDKCNVALEKLKGKLGKCKVDADKLTVNLEMDQIKHKIIRLDKLSNRYNYFVKKGLYHPFMSDVIANTICADLLDYLPRDRMNLGMEFSQHDRIQRFLTIRPGTLYDNEGLRLSILVTRRQKGGQRRDVATAVLRIMRERYEMSERVYYHHKKAAFSSMLAMLVEICHKLRDDEIVYPAPWTTKTLKTDESHILHFTDSSLIDYLGRAPIDLDKDKDGLPKRKLDMEKAKLLQNKLYLGIKYNRKDIYRTLLVLDTDLVHASAYPLGYFADHFRSEKRIEIEKKLSLAGKGEIGDVLIYCPSPKMQAKEVDARLEIIPDQILPLSIQQKLFAYNEDVRVLQNYYKELWRSYIFVCNEIFKDKKRCKAIIDEFCSHYKIDKKTAYIKVRKFEFGSDEETITDFMEPVQEFLDFKLPFPDAPPTLVSLFIKKAMQAYNKIISDGRKDKERGQILTQLLNLATLENYNHRVDDKIQKASLKKVIREMEAEKIFVEPRQKDGEPFKTFKEFENALVEEALGPTNQS